MKALLTLVVAATAALALSAPAHPAPKGCMATVGLSPAPDAGVVGTPWVVTLRVMQHGVRPLRDAQPVLRIRKAGAKRIAFKATPTARVGSYRARVVFPSAGVYRVSVYDGFPLPQCARVHTFGSVVVTDV